MLLAVPALMSGEPWMLLACLFLMATQSAFFSPAKYGILPEILDPQELSRGNALLECSTFLAIILGAVLGGLLHDALDPATTGAILLGLAVLGTFEAAFTQASPAPAAPRAFSFRPSSADLIPGFRAIFANRKLALTAIGIGWFWLLAAFLQMMAIRIGTESRERREDRGALPGHGDAGRDSDGARGLRTVQSLDPEAHRHSPCRGDPDARLRQARPPARQSHGRTTAEAGCLRTRRPGRYHIV